MRYDERVLQPFYDRGSSAFMLFSMFSLAFKNFAPLFSLLFIRQ